MKLLAAACFVLLLLNITVGVAVASDEARRHHHRHRRPHQAKAKHTHKLFVFGDDFADDGNSNQGFPAWRYPYGISDTAHDGKPTGRFSDGLVQSDFLAKIMGYPESPPPYAGGGDWGNGIDASGMNFAVADSGALEVPGGALKLDAQVQQLRNLVRDGLVDHRDFKESVALVGYSGNDYASANDYNLDDMVATVVDEIASAVSQLQDMGVTKVLVNTVPPFGCSPWMAKTNNYSSCYDKGNAVSDRHNTALRDRLGDEEDVMLLDVNSIVTNLVAPREGSALAGQFVERLRPCCEGVADADGGGGSSGYCGKDGAYSLCDNPREYFFWDMVHPTHAGWRAVMQLLQGPIMAFLGISNLEHL
ncbi:unnamed protein product [Urochloa decumbens]|uniref:GDSL esterase/lipase n=1 Tax=Urochloa decumbens TaxID=240449 RepID=A0ABC8YKK0_9POAL